MLETKKNDICCIYSWSTYVYGLSFFSRDLKELATYKMTVEDDHNYKLCPGAEWRMG